MRSALAVLVLFALVASSAAAQTSDEATKNAARALAEEGERLFDAGDYAGAADRFLRAKRLVPVPTLEVWLARALDKQGKLIEAEERYRAALRAELSPDAPDAFQKAVADAERELEQLKRRIPTLKIERRTGVGRVTLDGKAVPDALLGVERPLNPGTHRIEGEGAVARSISVAEGGRALVVLQAVSVPSAPPVGRGQEQKPREDSSLRTPGWIALGVGATALVVGVVTGIVAKNKASDLDQKCDGVDCPPGSQSEIDSFDTYASVSTGAFIGAGVGFALGTTLLVW
jgi:hypothetical protein